MADDRLSREEPASAGPSAAVPSASAEAEGAPLHERHHRRYVARWDLDKTYLRTDFETLRDIVRTALQRPDQKRTVPGAAALLRELGRAGVETHILSGSPEQLRSRLEAKLRLDGARWSSLTLKPNLQNMLRLRFRAVRGQLGYKLPALLSRRCEMAPQREPSGELIREVLLGDDAEADAFVYSLYADVCRGVVDGPALAELLRVGGAYEDSIREAVRFASYIERGDVVERILIHLDRQSSPSDFRPFGRRVVPFYNYLQAAFVLHEDGRLPAVAVLRVALDLLVSHNFDPSSLARSYLDLQRRGHLTGCALPELDAALRDLLAVRHTAGASELVAMMEGVLAAGATPGAPPVARRTVPPPSAGLNPSPAASSGPSQERDPPRAPASLLADLRASRPPPPLSSPPRTFPSPLATPLGEIDYAALVAHHNPRHARRR